MLLENSSHRIDANNSEDSKKSIEKYLQSIQKSNCTKTKNKIKTLKNLISKY